MNCCPFSGGILGKAFCWLTLLCEQLIQPLLLLLFRINWGWQLSQTGWGKLNNHEKVTEFFTGLGIPLPGVNAWFVGGVECIGGLLLLVGLFSRPAALFITSTMFVAYISVPDDRAALLNMFSDPEPFLAAAPFFFLLTALMVLAFGPGKISLDWLLRRCCAGKICNRPPKVDQPT